MVFLELLIQAWSAVMFKKTTIAAAITISTSVLLVACGGGNGDNPGTVVVVNPPTTGTLQGTPTTTAALSAAQFTGALNASASGVQLLQLAGTPKCGVTVSHIDFSTTGAAKESTTASGAVMVPTGTDPACTGKRPVVLYAHGTTISKGFNMAALTDPTNAASGETTLVAAAFAAQGYIVIAPNYAGYDTSTLSYHPYVNYKQQSQEMIDALKAGRAALPAATDSGKLFVTGYSEGGYVAMAALKAMDVAHIAVTAGAPMSGPYALAAYGDAIFYGNTPIGGTVFAPLLTTSYQKAYGDIYNVTSDAYTATFAAGIDTLLPTTLTQAQIFGSGKLPLTALFQSAPTGSAQLDAISPANPRFSFGFSTGNYLIKTSYRAAYLADAAAHPDGAVPTLTASPLPTTTATNGLRKAFALNDLRGYIPSMPVLMCGGNQDPTVFFAPNSQLMAGIMGNVAASGAPVAFALLDVDATNAGKVGFSSAGLSTAVKGAMTAANTQLMGVFGAGLQATANAAATAAQSDSTVLAGANTAATAAATAVLTSGGTPAEANAAATAAATAYVTAAATSAAQIAVATNYHGGLVPPVCTVAARTFFQQF
jgi:alpha/beta superfamily hydrolase